jgi:hypothetical protein
LDKIVATEEATMDWIKGTLLLIVVAGWVLSALAKKREPPRGLRAVAPPPRDDGDASAPPRRRRSAGEVDKFLEEVRRRRESMEGRKPQQEPLRPPVMPPVVTPSVVRSVEPRVPPPPRRLPQPPPLPTPRPQSRRTAAIVAADPVRAEIPEVMPAPITPTDPLINTTTIRRPMGSVTMRQTLALLNNRESLMAAMMLQEIIQRPVSKRKGRVPAYRK